VILPFHEINIDPELGGVVIRAIQESIDRRPGQAISLRAIVEQTGFPGDEVKDVFFALLTLRYLKPTFLPRHTACESVIGAQERSVEEIRNKIDDGVYPSLCARCHQEITSIEDLDIEIIFWKGRGGLFV
jgi:hypothetical protein